MLSVFPDPREIPASRAMNSIPWVCCGLWRGRCQDVHGEGEWRVTGQVSVSLREMRHSDGSARGDLPPCVETLPSCEDRRLMAILTGGC